MNRTFWLSLAAALALAGCDRTPKTASSEKAEHAGEQQKPGEHAKGEHEGEESRQLQYTEAQTLTGPDGVSYVHLGAAIGEEPEVTVAELNAAPEKWAGKTVRVTGDISTMCSHKRGWFAVVNVGDQTGAQLTVKTAPAFQVPEGAVGKRARAVGIVELEELSEERAKYFEKEHQLPAGQGAGPVKRVVLRATGADFI